MENLSISARYRVEGVKKAVLLRGGRLRKHMPMKIGFLAGLGFGLLFFFLHDHYM